MLPSKESIVQNLPYPGLQTIFPAATRMQRAAYDLTGVRSDDPDQRPWLRHAAWRPQDAPHGQPILKRDGEPLARHIEPGKRFRVAGDGEVVAIALRGKPEKREEMKYEGGVEAFVKFLDRNKTPLIPNPIMIKAEREGITVESALWWNDGYHESVLCFTNNIPQRDGGTHLAGFRGALTRQITTYAEGSGGARKEKVALTGDDCREGLTAVLSVKVPDPKFSSQTKDKLVSSHVKGWVESVVSGRLAEFFEENPKVAQACIGKAVLASQARIAARKPRRVSRVKHAMTASVPMSPNSSPMAASGMYINGKA